MVILKIYYKLSNKNVVQVLNDLLLSHIQISVTPESQAYMCTTFLTGNDIRNNILKLRQQAENHLIQCQTFQAMTDNLLSSYHLFLTSLMTYELHTVMESKFVPVHTRGIASLILSTSTRRMQLINTAFWLL